MHIYTEGEIPTSRVQAHPDLTRWSTRSLLGQYADEAVALHEAAGTNSPALMAEIEQDMAAVASEIERRTLDRDRLLAVATQLHLNLSTLSSASAALAGAISALPKDSDR